MNNKIPEEQIRFDLTKVSSEKTAKKSISEVLKDNFMPYAMSVIISRALPEIDGLKPSHRKLLYTMYEMGLLNKDRTKSANVAARTMLLNPHGDQGIYETAVRLTQNNETLLTPLIDGKGNFGKHYSRDAAAAASRYTEMKLMPVSSEFFKSIKKGTVDFADNYDSTRKEPVLLPVTFPNILANPTEGIAVGMASSIPSFNLAELCDAAILRIRHPRKNILEVMPGPDFTTGGIMLNTGMSDIYATGKGSIPIRAKYSIDSKKRIIEITEIPFTTTAEVVIENVISLIKTGKISEITDIRNEIGLNGFKIAIDYKRSADPEVLIKKLYKFSKLQDSYSCNMTVLIDGHPKELGVVQILDEWISWRKKCVVKELEFDLSKKEDELHILEGLAKVLLDINKAIKIIRKTEKDEDVIPALMKGFKISERQASYVADIKLRNLNKDYILNKTKNIEIIKNEILEIKNSLENKKEIEKIIIKQLKEVKKKYGKPRKTEIVNVFDEYTSADDQTADYPVRVYITEEGYVKKVALKSLKTDAEIKFKESDKVIAEYNSYNSKELLVFTDKQTVYKIQLSELKNAKPSDLPEYISNLCDFKDNEKVLKICTSDAGKNVIIGFTNGKVAKFPLSVYETKQNRKKLLNAYGGIADPLNIFIIDDDEDFIMKSSSDKYLVFNSNKVNLKTTKSTQGVQVLRLARNVTAVDFVRSRDSKMHNKENFRPPNIPAAGWKK